MYQNWDAQKSLLRNRETRRRTRRRSAGFERELHAALSYHLEGGLSVTGGYIELQIRWIKRPISAYRKYLFRDVLTAFSNLDGRADEVERTQQRVLAEGAIQHPGVDDVTVAEAAFHESLDWYQMMVSLRQTMLNLLAVGLFHLTEQQLAQLGQDVSFAAPPADTGLDVVKDWYKENLDLDLEMLPSYKIVGQLRLVANAVKHGDGKASKALLEKCPELFTDPEREEYFRRLETQMASMRLDGIQIRGLELEPRFRAPLRGEDLFVSPERLSRFGEGAESLFDEMADYFHGRFNEHYPKSG